MASQYHSLDFASLASGSGQVIWGLVPMPTMKFGAYEYAAALDEGFFWFAGRANVREVEPPQPTQWVITTLILGLKQGSVQAAGVVAAKWTYDGEGYELALALWSTNKTWGAYAEFSSGPPGNLVHLHMLTVGYNKDYYPLNTEKVTESPEDQFDPKLASMVFQGVYKVNGVEQTISGRALIGMAVFPNEGWRMSGLNLWINELHDYVSLGWGNIQQSIPEDLYGPDKPPAEIIVPPAEILEVYMKPR